MDEMDLTSQLAVREISEADYAYIIASVNIWWGGRNMVDMLPKLFFTHFQNTSFVIENDKEIVGFLIGFLSQSRSREAYIHFVGIHPGYRKRGIAKTLYECFFAAVTKQGRSIVRCVTSPKNKNSVAFHLRMGFTVATETGQADTLSVAENYDGPGAHRVLFTKVLLP